MTSLSLNTPAVTANTFLSLSSHASFIAKKLETGNNISYSFLPKKVSRKSAARPFSVDWDLNMNELEFE